MVEQAKLKLDLDGKPVDHTDYRSTIGSLMYVTSSRPDIMFATYMCARYQANPNEHHVSAVKRIFRYLKGTINLGLWYSKDSGFDLTAYSDADHAGCHLDRKTESEYVTVSSCCAQVLWMRTQLTDYGFFYDKVPIYCDSKSEISISCNPVQHTRTKQIDVSTTTQSNISLPEYDSFIFDLSNDQFPPTDRSAFTHEGFGDEPGHIISPPEYACFHFRDLLNSGELISSLNSGIRENLSFTTCVNLPVEDDYSPLICCMDLSCLSHISRYSSSSSLIQK
nr:hypothetical protein [Tanacetum cinerariifolium]